MNIYVCIGLKCDPQYAPDDPPSTGQKCDDLGTAWGSARSLALPPLPSFLSSLPPTYSLSPFLSLFLSPSLSFLSPLSVSFDTLAKMSRSVFSRQTPASWLRI